MNVVILNSYFDKGLDRQIEVNEVLDLDEDRIKVLKSIGVSVKGYDEELESEDDEILDDEELESDLIESYRNDKTIVDGLFAPDLKILCEEFGVSYSNVADAKESLKILTIS